MPEQSSTNVIYRDLHRHYPNLERGEGIYLFDADGKRFIDGSGASAAVTAIGHGVPEIIDAITIQASRIACAPTHAFSTEAIETCAQIVVEHFAPAGLDKVWFVSGGSEATENAVKIALQYFRDRGQSSKQIVIGRWGSFHGATLASLGYGGNTGRRRRFAASILPSEHISPCHPYRCQANASCPPCDLACANQLDYVIRQVGPENVAAFIAEPVVGATLGAVPATPGYLARIREICDHHDVLFIADEVMTGFGRTGARFGVDHWSVVPDIIACAKGIAGGYTPLGAVIVKPEIVGAVKDAGGSFLIGHTASGNPLSCATGVAVLRYVLDHNLVEQARLQGMYLLEKLNSLQDRYPFIGDVRGMGLLAGIEFVRDRTTKRPYSPDLQVSKRIARATFDRGLVSYPLQGSVDGTCGDHLLYAPPLTISRSQIDDLVSILNESLEAVERELETEH